MGMTFESHGVSAGCWTGTLQSDSPPAPLSVTHQGTVVTQATLREAGPGVWAVSADLPPSVIDNGVHSLLLLAGDSVLASLTLVAGTVAGDDLLAEVAQLRAELDLLKREFRRLATGG